MSTRKGRAESRQRDAPMPRQRSSGDRWRYSTLMESLGDGSELGMDDMLQALCHGEPETCLTSFCFLLGGCCSCLHSQ